MTVSYVAKGRELQHSRVMQLTWASGVKTKIFLDQGMGYWHPDQNFQSHTRFDFGQNTPSQIARLKQVFLFSKMIPGGQWPTYLTIVPNA